MVGAGHVVQAGPALGIHRYTQVLGARHSGRDCRNPVHRDVKLRAGNYQNQTLVQRRVTLHGFWIPAFWAKLKIAAHCAPFYEFFEVQMKIFIVAINILALFIIYIYRGDLVDLGWRAFGPLPTFLFLFFIGIHYCFGSQKWKNLSYGLVFIFEVTACSSIYTSIADRDNAFLNYIFMALLFSAISTLSVVNDRLEKLEN